MPDFFFIYGEKKKACKSVKSSCALILFQEKGAGTVARKYKRLRYKDRQVIEKMSRAGSRVVDIATTLGVHRDTIYKEYARCGATPDTYSAEKAQETL